jgi:hypothetical protein
MDEVVHKIGCYRWLYALYCREGSAASCVTDELIKMGVLYGEGTAGCTTERGFSVCTVVRRVERAILQIK